MGDIEELQDDVLEWLLFSRWRDEAELRIKVEGENVKRPVLKLLRYWDHSSGWLRARRGEPIVP